MNCRPNTSSDGSLGVFGLVVRAIVSFDGSRSGFVAAAAAAAAAGWTLYDLADGVAFAARDRRGVEEEEEEEEEEE